MAGRSNDNREAQGADSGVFKGLGRKEDGDGSVQRLSLKGQDAVVHGRRVSKDGRKLRERVADLDGVHV